MPRPYSFRFLLASSHYNHALENVPGLDIDWEREAVLRPPPELPRAPRGELGKRGFSPLERVGFLFGLFARSPLGVSGSVRLGRAAGSGSDA